MNGTPQQHIDDVAAELVLGLVSGPERSDALTHMLSCARCRTMVEELSGPADALLLLAPTAEPPDGFETRVLERFAPARPKRMQRFVPIAAVAAVVAVLLGVAALVGGDDSSSGGPSVLAAPMAAPDGRIVGQAFAHGGDPSWVVVAVPGWTTHVTEPGTVPQEYTLRIELTTGGSETVGPVALSSGRGAWGTTVDVDVDLIDTMSLVDSDGVVWCSATLSHTT